MSTFHNVLKCMVAFCRSDNNIKHSFKRVLIWEWSTFYLEEFIICMFTGPEERRGFYHFVHVLTAGWRLIRVVPRGPPELVQHFRLQGSSHRRKSAAGPKFDMVWQYRSPIPVGRRVVISSCRGRGVCGGQHPVTLWVKVLLSPTLYTTCDYCTRSMLLTNVVCCWRTRLLKGFYSSTKIFLGDRPTFKTQFCSQPSFLYTEIEVIKRQVWEYQISNPIYSTSPPSPPPHPPQQSEPDFPSRFQSRNVRKGR